MAVRTPLKLDGSNNLIEMDATDIANIKTEMIRQYGLNPSVTVTQVASGGTLGIIADTRLQSGTAARDTSTLDTAYPLETVTGEPTTVTVNQDKMSETVATLSATADTNNRAFPVYLNASGHIQAMTLTDMYDTFVNDVVNTLTTAATTTSQAGTYRIHTANTLAGHTLVSATPVFLDTVADIGDVDGGTAFLAANIGLAGTVQDLPVTRTSYYLFSIDPATVGTIPTPIYITGADHLQQFTTANFQSQLADVIRYYATQTGSRVDYIVGTSSTGARGSGMVDSTHTGGAGLYTTRLAAADDYRAQEFPNGTLTTVTTTYLRCVRA
jgi:hypothetical protein